MSQPKFTIARKGYVQADVDTYVGTLRDEISGLRDDLAKAQDDLSVAHDDLSATQAELTASRAELAEMRDGIEAIEKAATKKARKTVEKAKKEAAGILEAARDEASGMRSAIEVEEDELRERLRLRENEITTELDIIDARVGERTAEVEKLEERLRAEEVRYAERLDTLRSIALGLEDALRAVAEGSLAELGVFLETHRAGVVDNDIVGAAVQHHFTTDALLAAGSSSRGTRTGATTLAAMGSMQPADPDEAGDGDEPTDAAGDEA